jgi:hypothetical protein
MHALAACVALVALSAMPATAFTFNLAPGSSKCFTEELGTLHRVELHYKMAKSHATFVSITLTGPDGTALFQQKVAETDYKHYFHPNVAGEHALCFHSKERAALSLSSFMVTVTLLPEYEVETQRTYDHGKQEKNDNNYPLVNQARYIEHNLAAMHAEYAYLKEREIEMRDTNESTNSRTVWITTLTVLSVVAIRLLHHYTLRRHLKAKRILE